MSASHGVGEGSELMYSANGLSFENLRPRLGASVHCFNPKEFRILGKVQAGKTCKEKRDLTKW
jgi:hypothetical protein